MNGEGTLLEQVRVLEGERHTDPRGWLHVALRHRQLPKDTQAGDLYIVHTDSAGTRRGDHYHPIANEWFCVVAGRARLELMEPDSKSRRDIEINAESPRTVLIPAGLAHAIVNLGPGPLTVVAFSDQAHDPTDVIHCSTQATS